MLRKVIAFIANNSLSITLVALFLITLFGQIYTGHRSFNQEQVLNHLPKITLSRYLGTGHFLDGVFVNWQAAILQLGSLIVFSIFLVQRGATHSKRPGHERGAGTRDGRLAGAPSFLRRNSLSIAFAALFLVCFSVHLVVGCAEDNEQRVQSHAPSQSIAEYAVSAKFWFLTLQTWQAEYMAIATYIILSIFLRQGGSAESKLTEASDEETGEANE